MSKGLSKNNVYTLARAPAGQMRGDATQAMPVCLVEERQRSRCPPGAAPLQRAWGPAAKCKRYSLTGPKGSLTTACMQRFVWQLGSAGADLLSRQAKPARRRPANRAARQN